MSSILPLIIFKHTGTDTNIEQRKRQAMLGCAPAHKLFELVTVEKKSGVLNARSYKDYTLKVSVKNVPKGVDIGFAIPTETGVKITWNEPPARLDWMIIE